MDLVKHIQRQKAWSIKTFGTADRTKGVIDHIRKELVEIEKDPQDVYEWVDVIILAIDGAWRNGYAPEEIAEALAFKHSVNEKRQWPDWRTQPADKAVEHVRSTDAPSA